MSDYFVYRIENPDGQFYYGRTNSTNPRYNPFNYFIKMNEKNKYLYSNISQSLKYYGKNKHKLIKSREYKNLSKEEAEEIILEIRKKGEVNTELNDPIPKKIECEYCNNQIIESQIDRHRHIYCPKLIDEEIKAHFG